MVYNRLNGGRHRHQASVPSSVLPARYLNRPRQIAPDRTPNVQQGDTQPANPTREEEHTHHATLTVTPPPNAAPSITNITLIIDNHTFSTPHNPVKAFHLTRTQTIASFRAVEAGIATAGDMRFIFGAVLFTTATVDAASSDSDVDEWT